MRSPVEFVRELWDGRDLEAEVRLAVKMAVAGTMAWWLGTVAGAPKPLFATLVPLVALGADPFGAVSLSLARILGVFAGVGIGIGVLQLPFGTLGIVASGLLLGGLAGIVLRVGGRVNIQPAVSALFIIYLGRTGAAHAGVARIWETGIGAGVTVVVAAFLWPPDPVRELETRLDRLAEELTSDLLAVAEDLALGDGAAAARLDDVRSHSLEVLKDVFDLGRARNALRWNPLRRGDAGALTTLEAEIRLAARLFRHTRAITRDVVDAGGRLAGTPAGRELGAATRLLAEASELALHGRVDGATLERIRERLGHDVSHDRDALVVQAQLRQMHADLEAREPNASRTLHQ